MFVQVLVTGIIYTVTAGILSALITVIVRTSKARFHLARFIGLALGLFAALLYLQPFLNNIGWHAVTSLDPATYMGYFTVNPIDVITMNYGTTRTVISVLSSFIIAVGFLIILVIFNSIGFIKDGLRLGMIGGSALFILGVGYGIIFDATASSVIGIPIALLSFAGYAVPLLFLGSTRPIVRISQ